MVHITDTIAIAITISRTMAIDIIHITEVMTGLIIRIGTTAGITILVIAMIRSTIKGMIDMTVIIPNTIELKQAQVKNIGGKYLSLVTYSQLIHSFVVLQKSVSIL